MAIYVLIASRRLSCSELVAGMALAVILVEVADKAVVKEDDAHDAF